MTSHLWWYAARAGGIVAWAMLAASVIWGLALSTKALGPKPRPNWMLDLHRFLGGAAVVFTAVHVVSIILDSYVHFGLAEVLVPFVGTWHPMAVAFGIVGMYLLLAVQLTSMLRKHLSKKVWRATHLLSFPLCASATAHALTAGTDRASTLLLAGIGLPTAAILGLVGVRLWKLEHPAEKPVRRIPPRPNPPSPAPSPAPLPRPRQRVDA